MEALKVIFFGTAALALPSLTRLVRERGYLVTAVVTQPDRPKGRQLKLHPSPVKEEALRHKLRVLQPQRCKDPAFVQDLEKLAPDLIVVAAYGQILPASILSLPRHECINAHASLLPKYRGAAPIQWAILNGDAESGVTIMKMDAGMDTGDILTQRSTPIAEADTAQTLHDRLAKMGADLLIETIPGFLDGTIVGAKQSSADATHARKISKDDGRLDWNAAADDIRNRVRALTPWPGTFTTMPTGRGRKNLKILSVEVVRDRSGVAGEILQASRRELLVACGDGAIRILALQLEGGRKMASEQFLAGHSLTESCRFD